jgi:plasmid stabilization system protein ParE
MDASKRTAGEGLATFSDEAALDLAEIHTRSNRFWGPVQANNYIDLIAYEPNEAAKDPTKGKPVSGFEGVFTVRVKWKNAKSAHYIVYKPTQTGIHVSRILHSSMDLPSIIED